MTLSRWRTPLAADWTPLGLLDAPVLDGVTEADGVVAAMAVPVIPLEITKRPVARPSVTGRACGDRMRTPCLCVL